MQDHSCGTASMGPHDLSKWWHEAQQKVHHHCHLFWTRCFLFLRSSFAGSSFLRLYAKQLSLFTSFCIVFSGIDARGMLDSFHSCHTMAILSSCSFEFLLTSFSSAATSALLKSANTSFAFIWSTSWVEGIASGRWVNHGWSTDVLRLTVCIHTPSPYPLHLIQFARVWSVLVEKYIVDLWAISRMERKWFSHTILEELLQHCVSGFRHCVFWDPQTKPLFFFVPQVFFPSVTFFFCSSLFECIL